MKGAGGSMEDRQMFRPLSTLREGERAVVARIDGGEGVRKKLADMGILPGKVIGVTHGRGHGPRVVIVDQTKVMLGRGMLFKILVDQQTAKE